MDVSAIISKQLDEKLAELSKRKKEEKQIDEDAKAYIMSLFSGTEEESHQKTISSTSTPASSSKTVRKVDLRSILKRAKNA